MSYCTSLADAHCDSTGPRHVDFQLASQSANKTSPAVNQMSSFDCHVRPTVVSMPQTLNQTSDYSGMDSDVAESGVVQSFSSSVYVGRCFRAGGLC